MTAYEITGVVVGATTLLALVSRALWALHKGLNLIEHLVDRVHQLEHTLSNGIRSEVRQAAQESRAARTLAAQAATSAAVAQQKGEEDRANIERAVNALRAEINTFTNVAMQDVADIWQALREAGLDRRTDDP